LDPTTIVRLVCLLVVAWRCDGRWPLVVGANRDEWLDRPARAITVLQERDPRILGGRDERAGGTWLAVNEHGVVCGLTNRPMPDGPDPTRRSRGRLPLLAAQARTAEEAVDALVSEVAMGSYNPAWLLVGDRESLHYLAVEPDVPARPGRLGPGLHVLENAALDVPSVKVDHVRASLARAEAAGVPRWEAFADLLEDHTIDLTEEVPLFPDGRERLAATLAPCVHADGYGTRSSALVRVAEDSDRRPEVVVSDGPPCTAPFIDAGGLWWHADSESPQP
jgi:uncharacterized protein with NRDE domain